MKFANKRATSGNKTAKRRYRIKVENCWLTMPDGTRLATTLYVPRTGSKDSTRFPVLLEYLPYRKDDTFYIVDYPTYSYFAERGFIVAKVDIRGTGGSHGVLPDREYSDIELADADEIIAQLAALPKANGAVGMFGISWSGFNSLQVAMRRPPALKTIITMHSSDDLYYDDVHYADGVAHVDPYHLFINHETGLPRTPDYKLDEHYFRDRFERTPWIFEYFKHQLDSEWWRSGKSLKADYSAINIPVYIIGGLLDPYRSACMRMLENLDVPVKAEIGPWEHSSPDEGGPGPNYEWQDKAIAWFDRWLGGKRNGVDREVSAKTSEGKRLMVYVRAGHEPDLEQETAPGQWRLESWPIARTKWRRFYPAAGNRLARSLRHEGAHVDSLKYYPGAGVVQGNWWGDITGDARIDDDYSLVYDSKPIPEGAPVEIIGFPNVQLKVAADAKNANWTVRLEDVAPNGKVSLITAAMIQGPQQSGSREKPRDLRPGKPIVVSRDLHFTTWTFQPGHKIRLAIANAQFPIGWPSAELSKSQLFAGIKETRFDLPTVETTSGRYPKLPAVAKKKERPDAKFITLRDGKPDLEKKWARSADGGVRYTHRVRSVYRVRSRRIEMNGLNAWTTSAKDPASSRYLGTMSHKFETRHRKLQVRTRMEVASDKTHFHICVTRTVLESGRVVRRKTWRESFKRRHQ